jgi:hypothetical protein
MNARKVLVSANGDRTVSRSTPRASNGHQPKRRLIDADVSRSDVQKSTALARKTMET